MSVTTALGLLSGIALVFWLATVWRLRDHLERHERIPSIPRDLAIYTVIILLVSGTLSAFLHGRDLAWAIDLVALTARSSAMASGIVALWSTRKPDA